MKKILLGTILGAFVLFLWSFLAHMPPMGRAGLRALDAPQEEAVLSSLRPAMTERAIYFVPNADPARARTPQEQQARAARFESGPVAIVAWSPRPADRALFGSLFASYFVGEFFGDLVVAFLGAIIALSLSPSLSYWQRALILAAIGLISAIDVDASYWNWYGFPTSYTLAQFLDHVGGWFAAGLVLARVCRPSQ